MVADFNFEMLFIVSFGELVGDVSAMFFVDKVGRIDLQVISYGLVGVTMLCLGFGSDAGWSMWSVLLPIALLARAGNG